MNALPKHSPLGGSGAERWLTCPGSVSLSSGIEDFESEFALTGTAAHALAAMCLGESRDAWQAIGHNIAPNITVDKEMADAVQQYLDAVRLWHPDRNQGNTWIERPFNCPSIHPLFYGTADFIHWNEAEKTLYVWDYKHGAGVVVDVQENPQLMYYACGALEDLGLWGVCEKVVCFIAQPRGFHYAGPIRRWETTTENLVIWCEDTLIPGMNRAMESTDLVSGEHCRFCPARSRACPQLMADMNEMESMMKMMEKKPAAELSHEEVARFMILFEMAKIVNKAATETAFARLSNGHAIPGFKLANKRANRVWKDDAEVALTTKFGGDAYVTTLKTPAQIEAMPEGEAMAKRYAFKPDAGLTVVRASDARAAVSPDTKSLFKDETKTKRKGRK